MSFSISKLTLVQDCDELLAWAAEERADLDYRKITVERLIERYGRTSVEIESELITINAQIDASNLVLASLTDPDLIKKEEDNRTRYVYKKFVLENRKESYGAIVLLEKELDYERILREINEVDAFVAMVTAHRDTL